MSVGDRTPGATGRTSSAANPTSGLLSGSEDTIVAQATPAGRGALALLRLSGAGAHEISRKVATTWPEQARAVVLTALVDPAGTVLDHGILIRYDGPSSFTGEDAVEIATHGGSVVPTTVMGALVAAGARPALPGEFTRRAVLNGKLDVLQAEAIGDLVEASSRAAQRVALSQLDGGLSRRILALRDDVLAAEALVAYDIDFPEEDDGPVPAARVLDAVDRAAAAMDGLLATARGGEVIREGAVVVLAGAPNVGKSSLFNALLGRHRSIVTDVPGTTRDAIEARIESEHWPIRLVDTAGLRASGDVVERLGVEVSESYLRECSVVLACGDDRESLSFACQAAARLSSAPMVAVTTKSDLRSGLKTNPGNATDGVARVVVTSAETGAGVPELVRAIDEILSDSLGEPNADAPLLTQVRHRRALEHALRELSAFRHAWSEEHMPAIVAAVHLHDAVSALEELIGAVGVEDVLDQVFSRFCIGK